MEKSSQHLRSQTGRARELKFIEKVHLPPPPCHVPHVKCHLSCVTRHMSCVTCHLSYVMCHYFYFYFIFLDKVVKQVCGGNVINGATSSSSLISIYYLIAMLSQIYLAFFLLHFKARWLHNQILGW